MIYYSCGHQLMFLGVYVMGASFSNKQKILIIVIFLFSLNNVKLNSFRIVEQYTFYDTKKSYAI